MNGRPHWIGEVMVTGLLGLSSARIFVKAESAHLCVHVRARAHKITGNSYNLSPNITTECNLPNNKLYQDKTYMQILLTKQMKMPAKMQSFVFDI